MACRCAAVPEMGVVCLADEKKYNFCQECGENLILKRMPERERALGQTKPDLHGWCPKCRAYRG